MPSIRIHLSTLEELEELEPEELDAIAVGETHRQHSIDLKANPDARARSAELQARKRENRRKQVQRGKRH